VFSLSTFPKHPRFACSKVRSLPATCVSFWHISCSRDQAMPEERTTHEPSLHILIVDQNVTRASILEDGLREAGYTKVTIARDMQNLMRRIVDENPDVIFIDLENPNRDVLEQMFQVSRSVSRPIAMFVDRSDTEMIAAAVDAGVGAYVVDGLKKERVKAILDMAVSRFNAFNRLRDELDRAKAALDERKLIERAKGILMKERRISEEAAYALLRKAAMNENRRISEVAQSVVTAARLLK
jgi:response regulator NasT